ncbi:MAG: H4MPT-linked C1 transfer pathway protein, partial [Alphaproteobacteria bacterium]|nr:H4MPT-linked C1 transfer pathway protein [Alphaproteobacteria bacterium]
MQTIIGWDVGGAHLKAARAEKGVITQAVQIPSPLWLGVDELERAYAQAEAAVGRAPLNAVTMTGEQCDAFVTRAEGVTGLSAIMIRLLRPDRIIFYAGRNGFVPPDQLEAEVLAIASANWHASAALAGRRIGLGLFIDMGSTTTDIIPLHAGRPANLGFTDAERLQHG